MKAVLSLASLGAALALAAPAFAYGEGGVQVGTLSCRQHPTVGFVLGSSRRVSCVFQGPWGSSHYTGRMTDLGLDVGYHGPSQMVWSVFAPTSRIGPGALAGQYAGATAGASVVVGGSANGLIGGSDRTIQLQPFSVTGNTGFSATAGIAGMTLVYNPPVRAAPRAAYVPGHARRRLHHRAYAYPTTAPPPPPAYVPRG